jgi:predicted ATPase
MEGSTRLLEQLGERYTDLLGAYRQLLRATFERWNGHEVDTQGDAFFVAFTRATDAVSSAVTAQHALASHVWPKGVVVRVRMGIHTGEPTLSSEGYTGLDVHQASRIMSAGHGGQVLLSQTTRDLVAQDPPVGVSLRDMGAHRLKDLQHKSHLYQLVIADLPADFPPLKNFDMHPNNLPVQLTPLIGRTKEVALVQNLLQREDVRLLTLTGPGGIGKTRLGLQVAAELRDQFVNGVFFVNLASISDSTFVVPAIAQALNLKETGEHPLQDLLQASLQDRQLLLLLDNFEQVLGAAEQVVDLLASTRRLKVLVTSRAVLHVRGEQEFAVPPLAVPSPEHVSDLVALSQYEAVALFISRAQAAKLDFQLTHANARAIAEICAHLDGLPLAIELAAARVKLLPPQALLARLGQGLAVLTSRERDRPERQQTLRDTIAWSYHLLNTDEQLLFKRLSAFAGGCQLAAIEAMYSTLSDPVEPVLDGVASLLDKSLLQQTEQEGEEPRLLMLETIREYGLEVLAVSGEMERTREIHAWYYVRLSEAAEPELVGPQQAIWLERLEREHENLRAVMRWSTSQAMEDREDGRNKELALRLGGALRQFWYMRSYFSEGRDFLERALSRSKGVAASIRAKALFAATRLNVSLGYLDQAEALDEEGLALYRELDDMVGIAASLHLLAAIAWGRGNLAIARSQEEEALALFREVGDRRAVASALVYLGNLVIDQGEYTRASSLLEEGLETNKEHGDMTSLADSLLILARLCYLSQGDLAQAHTWLEESLALYQELGDTESIAYYYHLSGLLALSEGDVALAFSRVEQAVTLFKEMAHRYGTTVSLYAFARIVEASGDDARSRSLYEEGIAVARKEGNRQTIALGLEGLARVVAAQGALWWAARLWGAAETQRQAIGAPIPPVERPAYESSVTAARAQLGDKPFAAAWAEGRSMTVEQVLAAQGSISEY